MISVVIPCYNADPFLHQCFESIINQSYQDIQIILIDDGSTDNTPDILAEYAVRDTRIQVITQDNQGISAARNAGLKMATGNYIAFVDADDWLEPDTFVKVLTGNQEDLICFSYYRNFDNAEVVKDLGIEGGFPAELVQRRMVGLVGKELTHITSFDALITCWGKLYRREIVQEVKFRDLKDLGTWEDGIFNLEVLENATSVRIINKPFYHYRKVAQASYTSSYKEGLCRKWLYKFAWIDEFLCSRHKPETYFIALQNRIAVTFLNLAFNEMNSGKSFSEKKKVLKQILEHPVYMKALACFHLKDVPSVWKPFYYLVRKGNATGVTHMASLIHRVAKRNSSK